MKKLYIIAGPNGAGKTTASYSILPDVLDCDEFVNADEIAKGLSPFNPESVGFAAGRIMLERIDELLKSGKSFAFETTLSTRSYVGLIKQAKDIGFEVRLLFLSLESVDMAMERVKIRVKEGGHNIPSEVIDRRYIRGLKNLFNLYLPLVDNWLLVDNSKAKFELIADGSGEIINIMNEPLWQELKNKYYEG